MSVKGKLRGPAAADEDTIDEFNELFEQTDVDGDGSISYLEFKSMMADLDPHMKESAVQIGFREIDLDRDGEIDLAELRAWWLGN
ncbi:MAG TPA: EF-hand domain-containing protein [Steroidobacteraceae bacterium]|nr:EF-hand domain-containing protein [Steroidobacteraceae bacterium]